MLACSLPCLWLLLAAALLVLLLLLAVRFFFEVTAISSLPSAMLFRRGLVRLLLFVACRSLGRCVVDVVGVLLLIRLIFGLPDEDFLGRFGIVVCLWSVSPRESDDDSRSKD